MQKKFLFLIVSVIAFASASAQVFKNDDLQVSLIGDKTWVIETADNNTMYLIEGNRKSLLIDTGTKCKSLDKVIAKITVKPVEVVLTHAHGDHAGNIGYFKQIFMHPADTVLLDKSYKGRIRFIDDGFIFRLGGRDVKVYHMQAHTPGSIVLADSKTSSCFTGDAFGSGQVWLQLKPLATLDTYIASCKKMEKIMDEQGITKIYCGHYPYVKKAFAKSYIVKMQHLAEAILAGTAPETKPYDIKVPIGPEKPMIATQDDVGIVFDPDHIR